ncbi:MAG: prolyl oligopeptidase family serine peptidase [Acidimicrobiia bacterium]|nr:prolyl oligopeptidase family serine peptidase [Acidimicrobiia bacterium]
MSCTARTIALILSLGLATGPSTGGETPPTFSQLNQRGPDTREVDFYGPASADGPAPLVLLLHGGGNKGNDEMEPLAQDLASRGAVVAVPTYYSGQPRTRQDVLDTFEDVVCAIRYARYRAVDLGADPNNVTLVGFSYGGYPAMAIAVAMDGSYDFACLPEYAHRPQAVIGLGGAYAYDAQIATLGWEEEYSQFTTRGNAGNSDTPIVMVHGAHDMNVPIDHAEHFYRTLDDSGRSVALQVLDTRHAELIDPNDPAGAEAADTITRVAYGERPRGRTGPETTSVYSRLMDQNRG